jgi:triosephosphate isomerase
VSRTPLVVGNWKMHHTNPEAIRVARDLLAEPLGGGTVELALCPAFPALSEVGLVLSGSRVALGAQDLHWERSGAFTGEVSAAMLRAVGCRYAIAGHSERRRLFGDTSETAARKAVAALGEGMVPILCVGETLEEREAGRTEAVLEAQLSPLLARVPSVQGGELVLAYEPVWAIGTGRNATPEQAREAHAWLRARLARAWGGAAERVRILYGGSVTPENAASLLRQPGVDGALVGGASLEAASLALIARAAAGASLP